MGGLPWGRFVTRNRNEAGGRINTPPFMTTLFDPRQDRYVTCPECGPYAMGYGNYTVPQCYGGDCSTACGNPHGPFLQCDGRERLRDFYANGVQGGSPACRSCTGERSDATVVVPGLRPPFSTYAVNYFGDDDAFRARPYGGGVRLTDGTACRNGSFFTGRPDSGCTQPTYEQPPHLRPVPGVKEARTAASVAWPGPGNVCTSHL